MNLLIIQVESTSNGSVSIAHRLLPGTLDMLFRGLNLNIFSD